MPGHCGLLPIPMTLPPTALLCICAPGLVPQPSRQVQQAYTALGSDRPQSSPNPTPPPLKETCTYTNCKLELERGSLKEGGTVVVTPCCQPVWPALLDVHAVDDFVVSCDLAHGRATVPQEDGSKPSPVRVKEKKISSGKLRRI